MFFADLKQDMQESIITVCISMHVFILYMRIYIYMYNIYIYIYLTIISFIPLTSPASRCFAFVQMPRPQTFGSWMFGTKHHLKHLKCLISISV